MPPTGGTPPAANAAIAFSKNRDPSGAVAPVLTESGAGFDAAEVDSPAVAVDGDRPGGDKFLLYYEATSAANVTTIGVVSSNEEDFETLTVRRTQAIGLGAPGSGFESAATDPTVVVDTRMPFNTPGRYRMWFEGRSGVQGDVSTIITCTSADGVNWTGFTRCTGLNPSFGRVRVADPCVISDAGLFRMWFEAIDVKQAGGRDGPGSIGHADSTDGVVWILRDAAGNTGSSAGPVVTAGAAGTFNANGVYAPGVVRDDQRTVGDPRRFLLFFEAADVAGPTENTIGLATGPDGLTWQVDPVPVLTPSSDLIVPPAFDSGDLEHPTVYLDLSVPATTEGRYLLWYTGDGENGATPNRIGLAKGNDLP